MTAVLTAISPFFGIVLLGYVAARRGLIDAAGLAGVNRFCFGVALPPLLFRAMSRAPDASATALTYVAIYGAVTLGLYVLARLLGGLLFRLGRGERVLFSHLALNGNAGFLGLPLAAATLGPEAVLPTALALTFDTVIIIGLTVIGLESARGEGGFGAALKRTAGNPMILGALGGLAWGGVGEGVYGLTLPAPVSTLIDTLGAAAAPAALFATGAALATSQSDRRVGEIGALALLKLVAHPVAVFFAFDAASREFDIATPALWVAAATLAACCPASTNGAVFASYYKTYTARAAATVFVTTALGLFTYMAAAAWLLERGASG